MFGVVLGGYAGPVRITNRPPCWAVLGFLLGMVLQIGGLVLRGTGDVRVFKEWALSSVDRGLARSYTRPVRPRPSDATQFTRPDYPPLSVIVLFTAAQIALTIDPDLTARSRALTVMVKTPILLVRLAVLALVIRLAMGLVHDANRAWAIGLAHWLNPALILNGSTLGYLDPLCWGPGLAALVFAGTNRPALSGATLAATVLIKHQGAFFVLPVLACIQTRRSLIRLAVAFAGVAAIVVGPFLAFGDPGQLGRALMINLREDLLSGDALNLWWVATWIFQVAHNGWAALHVPMLRVHASSAAAVLGFHPRPFATVLVMTASLWAFARVRRAWSLPAAAALGALSVHTYFVLAIAVHENHLVYSVPLAAVAMLCWREYMNIFLALSAMVSINLVLFYGLGRDFSTPSGASYFLPLTVVLSLANVLFLAMHWRAFLRRTKQNACVPADLA